MKSDSDNFPFVSVIIPVYNDPDGVRSCLTALIEQTYPNSCFEVLVVDNGSTDETRSVVREFPVQLLLEDKIQGSYAARNRGIKEASGEILAFVDADCTPEAEWIESGVSMMVQKDADLVAGRVRFKFTSKQTAAERFDAKGNMRNDKTVRDGIGKTANLFTRRSVVDEIGMFPQDLRSGGDVYWTRSATKAGMNIVYSPDAIVNHPSRQLRSLLGKMYRVGTGSVEMWYLDDQTTTWTILTGLVKFPLKAFRFAETGDKKETAANVETPPDRDVEQTLGFYFAAGLAVTALMIGRIVGLVKLIPRVLIT
ncbi:glycosyltransferase [Natronorubrum texcoconense]|uniref:Glycosyltransferase, GT2 family n=1 Tax=Natronorubrum texcoconense TaxID=1095776 RepID=A0A1G8VS98_9EURY|nr:glycosyltransferase [Natronorubrum texcoconense]SDJ68285.1 Glycosyltransferase, GT2 family [Natronorubrum texcoconense]